MLIETIFHFILNTFSGMAVTIFTLIVFHLAFAPRIRFSDKIRLFFPVTDKIPYYSIRFIRSGMIDLIDVTISCRLTVKDIAKNGRGMKEYYTIKTSSEQILMLQKGSLIVHLYLRDSTISKINENSYFGRSVKVRYPEYGLRFEDIFLDFKDVNIQVFLIGHDRFSGVKKIYTSPQYCLHNIQLGRWGQLKGKTLGKHSGLQIIPSNKIRNDNY